MSKIIKTTLLSLFCIGAISLTANAEKVKEDLQVRKDSSRPVKEQENKLTKLKLNVDKDVNNGLNQVGRAIKNLDEGKVTEALDQLKDALGSFDIALAADPDLNLVPVSSVVNSQELYTDSRTVTGQVTLAKKLLSKGKVQQARDILLPLRSDVTETVTYLPMATYPDAIRRAVSEIANENIGLAKDTLATAMSTLVRSDVKVVPIPLLTARSLIDHASKMDKEKEKAEIEKKLSSAKAQLELAHALGYELKSSKQYQKIRGEIGKIEKEIKGENKVEKLYSELKTYFTVWMDRVAMPFFPKGATPSQSTKG